LAVAGMSSDDIADRLADIRARIASAGDPSRVQLVAVSKGHGVAAISAALDAGVVDIGESYAQELEAKAAALEDDDRWPHWHFIGGIQRNKVRKIAGLVHLWHSVDRLAVGAEIARWAPGAAVLVQVNTTGEAQKGGCPPARALAVVEGLRDLGLDVRGLMTVGPIGDPEASRPCFRQLRELADGLGLVECSMGMTADVEVAVEEGATLVRVGTALFGPRSGTSVVGK
jgi:pyridoxal phosphate enzyme (YggS family)